MVSAPFTALDTRCVNTIRILAADMVQGAASGHPGAPMGMAPIAHVLFSRFLKFNPKNPEWLARDRFVLSNGHACALQYVMLHLMGYEGMNAEALMKFRQVGSKLPGHPENVETKGVEVTTGPLGQGVANAVGLAVAQKHLDATYGPEVIGGKVFCFVGDGCLQEGVSGEACSLAGHWGLDNLVVIYDDNNVTIDGPTSHSFTEDVAVRYESYGWHVVKVANGDNDLDAIAAGIQDACNVTGKPVLVQVKTTIGYGSANQGTGKVHGAPLGEQDLADLKKKLGFKPEEKYIVPEDVAEFYRGFEKVGKELEDAWKARLEAFGKANPKLAAQLQRQMEGKLPLGWKDALPKYAPTDKPVATRVTSGNAISALLDAIPEFLGGSADLTPSNNTRTNTSLVDFQSGSFAGRYFRFGIREHAMAAICNGMARFGILIPFAATFLCFLEYLCPAWRLSALSQTRVLYVMTHDSIGLGEDGPTHQPVEHAAFMRAMPNSLTMRPADGNETNGCYIMALEHQTGPSVLCLSRQAVPQLAGSSASETLKGGYIVHPPSSPSGRPESVLVSSGTEVSLCIEVAKLHPNTHVVSVPCWEKLFQQPHSYLETLFPPHVPVLAVEPYSRLGWERVAHDVVCMTGFGASGKQKDVYKAFGFTVENISARLKSLVGRYSSRQAPNLLDRPAVLMNEF